MLRGLRPRFALGLMCLFLAPRLAAQEWTRFRGPNGSGVSSAATIPAVWTEQDENWRVKLPGIGHSSPVLWGNRVFLTAAQEDPDGRRATRIVLCLDATDGSRRWRRNYATLRHGRHKLNSLASSTPAVDDRQLYLCWVTADQLVATALDHQGNERWQVNLGDFITSHGYGMSPIVCQDVVIVANDQQSASSLIGLDRHTGKFRWRVSRDTKVTYSTPCLYRRTDGIQEIIFTNWRHGITAVDPATGETNWEISVFQQKTLETAIASPFVAGNLIFATCGYLGRGMHTVAVRLNEATPPEAMEVLRIERGAPLTTTPLVYKGLLFLWSDSGITTCADGTTGQILWRKRVGGNFYGSPVGVANRVYCLSAEGEAIVLAASETPPLVTRVPLGEGSHSTPAVARGKMYLRTFSHLISIGDRNQDRSHGGQ